MNQCIHVQNVPNVQCANLSHVQNVPSAPMYHQTKGAGCNPCTKVWVVPNIPIVTMYQCTNVPNVSNVPSAPKDQMYQMYKCTMYQHTIMYPLYPREGGWARKFKCMSNA